MSDFTYKIIRITGVPVIHTMYHPKGRNTENIIHNEPLIICSNHLHYCDQYVIETVMYRDWKNSVKREKTPERMIHWFAKNEYSTGYKSHFYRSANCIFVKRGSAEAKECLKEGINVLEKGHSVGIFPEGTRNSYFFSQYKKEKLLRELETLMNQTVIQADLYLEKLEMLKETEQKISEIRADLQSKKKNARIVDEEPLLGFHLGAAQMSKITGVKMLPVAVTGDYTKNTDNILVNFGVPVNSTGMSDKAATDVVREKVLELVNENRRLTNWMI